MLLTTIKSYSNKCINNRISLSLLSSLSIKDDEEAIKLTEFITSSKSLFIITGAGISTSSGIPDYRSPQGSYSKGHKPIVNDEFINNEYIRKRYWARSMIGWPVFNRAKPNEGHYSLSRIESRNINKFSIITQNVDRLHQKAGSRNVIDLHGRNDRLICLSCNSESSRNILQKDLELMNPEIVNKLKTLFNNNQTNNLRADGDANLDGVIDYGTLKVPPCRSCGGVLKPMVVFFGDNVNPSLVQDIYKTVDESDALLVVGTSLFVYSGYRFVDRFAKKSDNICVINQGTTIIIIIVITIVIIIIIIIRKD